VPQTRKNVARGRQQEATMSAGLSACLSAGAAIWPPDGWTEMDKAERFRVWA